MDDALEAPKSRTLEEARTLLKRKREQLEEVGGSVMAFFLAAQVEYYEQQVRDLEAVGKAAP